MQNIILNDISASISELKKNPMRTVGDGDGFPVAVLKPESARVLLCTRGTV